MSLIEELEDLAYFLPCEQSKISTLSKSLQNAIRASDGNLIKKMLSENNFDADMTRVTSF